jgi:hypothetical protein
VAGPSPSDRSLSGVNAIIPLVAFCDIHGGKREVQLSYFVPDTTRDHIVIIFLNQKIAKILNTKL